MEVSSASGAVSGGRIDGSRAASMDLPAPGLPTIIRWWRPAAAISSARLARSCPFTSLRSRPEGSALTSPGRAGSSGDWPVKCWITAGRITGTSDPSRDSSPSARVFSTSSAGMMSSAASTASAMGRSKCEPSLGRSAGDILMVILRAGRAMAIAFNAARTRSRASETALSGRPTIAKEGMPGDKAHCTSTRRASMPWKATVYARATMGAPCKQLLTLVKRSWFTKG